ncbi:hypothetical protein [Kitasatospora sp. NRRL B-11411]|uniref:hypothetical protein n=1 Tax=Kitasatospora sp. NRRL B-11411 TaxID=1463822 RepID=UPI0004C3E7B5|nr:hypothetical protein [Kitasatospora sp. NRRL B-11411]
MSESLSPRQQALNVRAFSAVVAKFREALLEGPEALAVARDIVAAFAESGASGGPTRSDVWRLIGERYSPQYGEDFFDARWAVFEHYGAIQPYLAKKHQQRYALHPAVGPAILVHERLRRHRGIDELAALLDETRTLLSRRTRDRAVIEANLSYCRQMISLYAIHLERLVADAGIRELAEEQREHNHPGLSEKVEFLNREVSDHFPNDHALDHQAMALLNAEQRYQRALSAAAQRIVEQGGRSLDFAVLSVEEYLEAARHAPLALLGGFGADLVADTPTVWIDAGTLMKTVGEFAPYTRVRRRPAMPRITPERDPLQRLGEARVRERSRQDHLAERLLVEGDRADLTEELRNSRWPAAARLLADLIGLDADPYAPYRLEIGISLIVDRVGWVTYLHPVYLHRQEADAAQHLRDRGREEHHEAR